MQQLIYFLQKYKYLLYFLLLEIIAVALIINNHSFHKSKFISSANAISGGLFKKVNSIREYTSLKKENNLLLEENKKLKNQLEELRVKNDTVSDFVEVDSLKYHQKYFYIDGKVIDNNYHLTYNFLTINRGKKHNISPEMAVVNSKGIIGITEEVSENYARVQSILNKDSKVNARFKNNPHYGSLEWNGKDYNVVQLTDIPRQARFQVGDTIITDGKSAIFPEGIPVGVVKNIPQKITAKNTIDIQLFNDMSSIGSIYIIKNFHKSEIKALNNQNE
ncbi:rod shape-determining protein MreC [Tenacibaculum sp. 190524A02b]|uniref:Cell shape-determining protein MreC n=1 Tax=Tenacibaculum vairaonense TaxID=3137860 RepID=A0ABM9PLM1_9FLAO